MLLLPLAAAGNRRWRAAGLLVLMFGGGFYYAAWRADMRLAERLPQELIWQDVWAEGTIRGFAETTWRRSRFVFDIEKIGDPPAPFNLRASVSDYHFNKAPLEGLRDGAKWRLKIRVRPPRNNYNPNGFDRAGWFFSRGIRAEGYVRDRKSAMLLEEGGGLRDSLRQQTRAMPERGELLAALIVGDRGGIDEKQWRVLRQTGVAHLMSISGTHITLTAVFAALLVGFVWRRNRRLTRRMPAQKAALLAAIPLAVFYAWLAGFGVPVQRSLLMFLAAAAAMLFGIGASPIRTVFPAAALVIAVDPWAVLSAGFWLSFLIAAAVIAALVRGNYVFRLLKMQFVVSLFAMPLTLWFFNEASLVSPLANAVAVPFAGLVILPLTLADIVVPGDFLWRIAGHGLSLLMSFLEFCSELPFASRQTAAPWHVFVAAALGGGWLLMPTGTPLRWAGVLPIVAMLLWRPPLLPVGDFRLTALDVGQGSATVIETSRRTMIYDTGPRHAFSALRDFLRGQGRQHLDIVMVSHDNADHSGAARRLTETMPVSVFSSSVDSSHRLARQAKAETYMRCESGRRWEWDGVRFEILHPPPNADGLSANARSCVLKIESAHAAALLTGDIPSAIENQLPPEKLSADILLAAHHGSRGSSSSEFLQATSPSAIIFSAGENNPHGHPHPEALHRARESGATIYRTDLLGAVSILADKNGIRITQSRPQIRRYWHPPLP